MSSTISPRSLNNLMPNSPKPLLKILLILNPGLGFTGAQSEYAGSPNALRPLYGVTVRYDDISGRHALRLVDFVSSLSFRIRYNRVEDKHAKARSTLISTHVFNS